MACGAAVAENSADSRQPSALSHQQLSPPDNQDSDFVSPISHFLHHSEIGIHSNAVPILKVTDKP